MTRKDAVRDAESSPTSLVVKGDGARPNTTSSTVGIKMDRRSMLHNMDNNNITSTKSSIKSGGSLESTTSKSMASRQQPFLMEATANVKEHEQEKLTGPANNSNNDDVELSSSSSLHFGSIIALCFGMLTHSYLLISVFPYSGYMAIQYIESANEDNAGSYAGLLASSFNFGRTVTAYSWGTVADVYGRKAALIASLSLSCVFSLLFGLSPSFGMALLIRFSIGLSNAIVGTNKTLVSDLGQGNEKVEAKTMGLVLGMWAWGFFISPFVSGQLAEPVKQYPDLTLWNEHKALTRLLERFPFLLPNLLGAVLCLVALILCHCCIQETLPDDKRRSPMLIGSDAIQYFKEIIFQYRQPKARYQILKSHQSDILTGDEEAEEEEATAISDTTTTTHSDTGDHNEIGGGEEEDERAAAESRSPKTSVLSLLKRPQTRSCLLVYWGQSFVTLAIDEMFPLFCISTSAGFGLSERKIGQILSTSGIIFAFCQYWMQSIAYSQFGLYGAIRAAAVMCAPTIFLFPVSLLINRRYSTTTAASSISEEEADDRDPISVYTFAYLCFVLAMTKSFMLVFFANISVAINRTVPADSRAALNGLSILGSSVAKGLGPSFAGLTATMSVVLFRQFGSLVMFGSVGFLSLLVAVAAVLYLKEEEDPVHDELIENVSVEMTETESEREIEAK
ncbi:hypothetical protein ACA910_006069 [Epithemia clementina (nom. ined.)]